MNKKNTHVIGLVLAIALLSFMPRGASADESDPPSRVARLAYAEGTVSFQPGGTEDWVAAPINRPMTTGDQLWADRDSRAELQLDGSTLRLAGSTAVSLLNLGDNVTQVRLLSGTLLVRVQRLDDDETYEIDTPNLAFSILRPGLYRLTVDESGASTAIRVRSGQGEVTGGGTAYMARPNENDIFSGTDQLTENVLSGAAPEDAFDAWSASRDGLWENSVSARYVSPDVVGYEDLDNQGAWRPVPEYGTVWFPNRVAVGWAPYHFGHWSYIAPWGYTWVDDQPWGFAPFHYGRWVSVGGSWGWIPAPPRPVVGVYVRPVYAPALVAWVGVGAGVAWFALGPREVYVPSYPVSRRYVNNINVSNTTVNTTVINNVYNTTIINNKTVNVTNVNYVNRHVPGAITAVSAQAFKTAQPVSKNIERVDERALSSAPVHAGAPATMPTKQAVLGSARVVTARPPLAVQTRMVVARTAPPSPPPAFETRERAIQANGGKPLSVSQVRQIQANEIPPKSVRIAPAATPVLHTSSPTTPATPATINRAAASAVHPNDLPPVAKAVSPNIANSALEREHLQQQQQMLAQQEQARQRIQQQQDQAHQQLQRQQQAQQQAQQLAQQQQHAQQLEQQHQQQTQQLAQQHAQAQAQLQKRQQEERQAQENQTKSASASRKSDHAPNPR
jgi:flagellar biosynthesis GTPase FlhF